MSTDVDPLNELFSDQGAKRSKAGGKFQPKVKPQPKKGTSIKLPSSRSEQNIKSADSEIKKPSKNKLDSVSGANSLNYSSFAINSSKNLVGETLVDNAGLQTDVVLRINQKPAGGEVSSNTDVDPLDEIFPGNAARSDKAGDKFSTKTESSLQKDTSVELDSLESVQNGTAAENKTDNPAENNLDSSPGVDSFDHFALVNNNSSEQPLIETFLVNNLSCHTDVLSDVNVGEGVSKNSLDSLDEIFTEHAAKSARAGSKFLPKPKIRPIKGSSIKMSSSLPAQNARVASNEIEKASGSNSDNNHGLQVDVVAPYIDEKATQMNADTIVGLEPFDSSSFQSTIPGVGVATGSLNKVDSSLQLEAPAVAVFSTLEVSTVGVSNASSIQTCTEDDITTIDTSPQDESVVSHSSVGVHFTDGVLEVEEVETSPCTEGSESIYDMTTRSGQRRQKLQPKPKFQIDAKKNETSTSLPDESEAVPFFDYNDLRSEVLPSEGLTGPSAASFLEASNSGDHPVDLSDTLEKSVEFRERNSSMVFNDSLEHQEPSMSGKDDEAVICTRKLRKRTNKYSLVDEDDHDVPDVHNMANDSRCSPIEDEDRNDGENEVEGESQKEKKAKRSRKSSSQKEKPVRKRKKGNEAVDQTTQKPRKKFSHSTRRNKRQADRVLLETPEDEIDMKKLRIRDIILLAEHRERLTSKEVKTTETTPANQSAGPSFTNHNDNYFGDGDFASEGGQFSNEQTTSSNYFNYHSYMKKTPRSRWSNQDTELFYEGVQQFGSDISMIQQLFPDRTRAQVKLKYKKEERQQPLRLHEALTNRPGDHSHFQRVIEQLKKLAGAENQNSFEDDSIDVTGNGEEVNPGTNEEAENLEESEKREDDEMEPDACEAQSPPKSTYDSEDESYTWCQYKSEL